MQHRYEEKDSPEQPSKGAGRRHASTDCRSPIARGWRGARAHRDCAFLRQQQRYSPDDGRTDACCACLL